MRNENQLTYDLTEVIVSRKNEKEKSDGCVNFNGFEVQDSMDFESLNESLNQMGTTTTYHELSDFPIQETDLLTQLRQQVDFLEDLIRRNNFLMREVRYLLKK